MRRATVVWMLLNASGVFADVRVSETLAEKVVASSTIAVGTLVKVEGELAFFRVTRAIRGAKTGDTLRVPWRGAKLAKDAECLLLVSADPNRGLRHRDLPFPDLLAAPSARQVEVVAGLATFSVEVTTPEEQHLVKGGAVPLEFTVRNDSATAARFELSSVRLSGELPLGQSLRAVAPVSADGKPLPAWSLEPGARQRVSVDLAVLFPRVFGELGDRWFELELPAQGGDHLKRHVELGEPSIDYQCGRASAVLRARVKPAGKESALEDPIYLRLRGERLPKKVAFSVAGTGRMILCAEGGAVTLVRPDTAEAREKLKALLVNDSSELWPREEDADPRFAPKADGPPSEQRSSGLDRRLQPLPE